MSDTTYYFVDGFEEPFWAVTADKAVNLDSETDMGDLTVEEFTNWFLPMPNESPTIKHWRESSHES
jgi:hypothetical protein